MTLDRAFALLWAAGALAAGAEGSGRSSSRLVPFSPDGHRWVPALRTGSRIAVLGVPSSSERLEVVGRDYFLRRKNIRHGWCDAIWSGAIFAALALLQLWRR